MRYRLAAVADRHDGRPSRFRNIDRPLNENQTERLRVEHLTVKNKEGVKMLDDVTFTAMGGEILGIAGIAGSGQKELLESISGLQKLEDGSKITYIEPDGTECLLNGHGPASISSARASCCPASRGPVRHGALSVGMNIIQNIMLRTYRRGKGPLTDRKFARPVAERLWTNPEVAPLPELSKAVPLSADPSYVIYNLQAEQKMKECRRHLRR